MTRTKAILYGALFGGLASPLLGNMIVVICGLLNPNYGFESLTWIFFFPLGVAEFGIPAAISGALFALWIDSVIPVISSRLRWPCWLPLLERSLVF